jgi:septal ring factor EnvC (AmiA/AmiB activator)
MKNIIFFIFLTFSSFVFTQKTNVDTSIICFPTEIGKEVLKDLNELDKLRKTNILDKKEIEEFEKKVKDQDSIISKLEEKDRNNEILVKSTEEKYKLLEEDNNDLRKEIKNIKIKNNIIEIVSAVIFSTITYIQLFK